MVQSAWVTQTHSSNRTRGLNEIFGELRGVEMAASSIEKKALSMLNEFENAGKIVNRVIVSGRKIELVLGPPQSDDEFEGIDMRHGKA